MLKDIQVGIFKVKTWWYIFYALQIFIIVFMIASLFAKSWVKSDFNICISNYYNFGYGDYSNGDSSYFCGEFDGSLYKCTSGCEDLYGVESMGWCYNDYDRGQFCNGCDENALDSLCKMFKSLSNGSVFYILGEILTFCAVFVWFLAMILSSKKRCCYMTTYVFSICSCVWHYIGILTWFGITHVSFSGCGDFAEDGRAPVLCATSGPSLAVFLMVVLPIIVVLYFIVACVAYNKGGGVRIFQKVEENDVRRERENFDATVLPCINPIQPANPNMDFNNSRPADPRYYNTNQNNPHLHNYNPGLPVNLPLSSSQAFEYNNRINQNPPAGNINVQNRNTTNSKIYYIFYDPNNPPDLNDPSLTLDFRPISGIGNNFVGPNFRQ